MMGGGGGDAMTLDPATVLQDQQALAICEDVVALTPDAWPARAAELCAGQPALLHRVTELLARAADADTVLQTGGVQRWFDDDAPDALPDRVGPYRLTGVLGRGGMGVVARGERDDGVFDQQVAIKLMRGQLHSPDALNRFLTERRILGRLVAPGIARILDGGSHGGIPWLAMDLVEGASITDHAAAARLALPARLALFRQACAAVAFAHRALVIHADIKPSNILVDAAGTAKLVDFGIAQLMGDAGGGDTALTRHYAAPERLAGGPPSVAADVFALGRVLADLLAGQRVDADLAAIAAKAVAADPAQRYPDVPALLADLDARDQHWLVSARATPLLARAAKFLRRQRIATGIGLGLIAATALVSVQYWRAERARAEAEQRFFEVRDLSRFMLFPHYDALADVPGTAAPRAALAAMAGRYLDRLASLGNAPQDLRLDTARGYRRLATVLGGAGGANLGRTGDAQAALDKAAALLAAMDSDDAAVLEERGWVQSVRWTTLADTAESTRVNAEAARLFAAALAREPARPGAALGAITAAKSDGFMLLWEDEPAKAAVQLKQALARLRARRWPAEWADQARALEYTLLAEIGNAAYYADGPPASLAWYREGAALVDAELARRPTQLWYNRYGDAQYNLAGTLSDLPGQRGAALAAAEAGRRAMEARLALGFDESIEKRLTSLLGQESLVLEDMGQTAAAIARQRDYVAIRAARLARNPDGQQVHRDMGIAHTLAAEQYARLGRRAEACNAARAGNAIWDKMAQRGWLTAMDARRQRGKLADVRSAAGCS